MCKFLLWTTRLILSFSAPLRLALTSPEGMKSNRLACIIPGTSIHSGPRSNPNSSFIANFIKDYAACNALKRSPRGQNIGSPNIYISLIFKVFYSLCHPQYSCGKVVPLPCLPQGWQRLLYCKAMVKCGRPRSDDLGKYYKGKAMVL